MPTKPKVSPAILAWRAKNPLHKWLAAERKKADGETIITLANRLNAARQTIYTWLYGDNLPLHAKFVAMKRLCGVDFYAWMAWLEKRPTASRPSQGGDSDAQTQD